MPEPQRLPIFYTSLRAVAQVAVVSLTLATAVPFTEVRCLCARRVMTVPGLVAVEVRKIRGDAERSGRGRILSCPRCRSLLEVIEHGR